MAIGLVCLLATYGFDSAMAIVETDLGGGGGAGSCGWSVVAT